MSATEATTESAPTTATLGSMLLASADPARLRDWYVAALRPVVSRTPGDPAYDVLDFNGFYVMVDTRDDIGATNPEPARVILNFEVADARDAARRIDRLGTEWVSPLEDREGSWFATATDPDGNYVQIIELSDEARAAMAADEG
jgi:predicted enzyme related to lactoylglutathione lyase